MKTQLSDIEKKQMEYYNSIAKEYDLHYASKEALLYRDQIFNQILSGVDLNGKKILDAMCGGGQNGYYFINKNSIVTGIDLSDEQCANYKKRFPENEVVCGSILDTQFPSETFDLIVIDSLHHLHPHVNKGIKELIRILKPSGYLLIWEPSHGSIFDIARKIWYKLDTKYFEDNEAAIDVERIKDKYHADLVSYKTIYGGNLAYLFVFLSMAFRIPQNIVKYYAKPFLWIERLLSKLQGRLTSLWVLALFKKNK